MSVDFTELVRMARNNDPVFAQVSRQACVEAAKVHLRAAWSDIRARHSGGLPGEDGALASTASGLSIMRLLTQTADEVVTGVAEFGLYATRSRRVVLGRVALCALGGYGRSELNPYSDLDICLLYDDRLEEDIKTLNSFLMPFLWDAGFKAGYALYSVNEAAALAKQDPQMYTTYAQARLLLGDTTTFARLRLLLAEVRVGQGAELMTHLRRREDPANLPAAKRDLYNLEPDVKENVGGLRDYHAGLWMIQISQGPVTLDGLERMGHLSMEEYLELSGALDFMWRVRNEMHFHARKADNLLSFAMQRHIAEAFGYAAGRKRSIANQRAMDRFMQDYYAAAARLRHFLHVAIRICDRQAELDLEEDERPEQGMIQARNGMLFAATSDRNWFAENPARLMQLFWVCARRRLPLSPATARRVQSSLSFVDDSFRGNDVVRRYFLALCNRPLDAGFALRQMSASGLLGAYIPEFGEVGGIVRYEDFHSYPVDEHTIRAVEALAEIGGMEGRVAEMLQETLDHLREPWILVIAILFHDLGKAEGEEHVDAGVRMVRQIGARMGLEPGETEQIAFLVQHHMLMTNIAIYRDTDDVDIVNSFAQTMHTVDRLRELLLLTYADLKAVGPNVWTEWKGALLLKLFLRAERILLGRPDVAEEEYWKHPKAVEAARLLDEPLRPQLEGHLRDLGERYFIAFTPVQMSVHVGCLEEARRTGLAVRAATREDTRTSEVVVCTRDHRGLFAEITGAFTAHLIDVEGAALFTSSDGFAVDCFTVRNAANGRPLTEAQCLNFEKTLRAVVLDGVGVQDFVDQSRKRLFALLQPRVPVRTAINFDNQSSRTDTVIDVVAGDRTGLLYDISRSLASMGVDLNSARIVTDARHVRDAFYVRLDSGKIESETAQASIREGLIHGIDSWALAETQGDFS